MKARKYICVPRCVPIDLFVEYLDTLLDIFQGTEIVVIEANSEHIPRYQKNLTILPFEGEWFKPSEMIRQMRPHLNWEGCEAVVIPTTGGTSFGYENMIQFAHKTRCQEVFLLGPDHKLLSQPTRDLFYPIKKSIGWAWTIARIVLKNSIAVLLFILLYIPALILAQLRFLRTWRPITFHAYQTERNAGTRYRSLKMARYVRQLGHDIHIWLPAPEHIYNRYFESLFDVSAKRMRTEYLWAYQFPRRLMQILGSTLSPVAVVHYFMMPVSVPFLELLLKPLVGKIVYEYDDSLWAFKKHRRYLERLLPHVDAVVAGNKMLMEYAEHQGARRVELIPTCVDLSYYRFQKKVDSSPVVIGWIGTPANIEYLEMIVDIVGDIAQGQHVELQIVSSLFYRSFLARVSRRPYIRFIEWRLEEELSYFDTFDIGLMPVKDDLVGRGKCGFKLLQYMASGIPAVASPIGVNCDIVEDGENGFLASSAEEWRAALERLAASPELRNNIGKKARLRAADYSFERHAGTWDVLLRDLSGKPATGQGSSLDDE